MSWKRFLEVLCQRREYELTPLETEVILCLEESKCQTKNELLRSYVLQYSEIEDEAFTQRLKNIYKKFQITGSGHKLPQLHKYVTEKYVQYQNKDVFFSEIGLTYVYPQFPREKFKSAIEQVVSSKECDRQHVDILQTFAPNLDDYFESLVQCLQAGVSVRVLLAWPYSEAARLREEVLRKYASSRIRLEINIRDCVIANLETLERIIEVLDRPQLLEIRLYDTLPSLAMYRAGDYLLAGLFLHGALAIDTFQLELNLTAANQTIVETLQNDFELLWQVARPFEPEPTRNWRSDLKILFTR